MRTSSVASTEAKIISGMQERREIRDGEGRL
jgi:hypothetical protein